MNALTALATMTTLAQTAATLAASAASISVIIQKAQAEGRADLTADEVAEIAAHDGAARLLLADAIARTTKP